MKIAAIDIGTNAVKAKVFNTSPSHIEFIESNRSAMRLGTDVFVDGKLSKKSISKLIKILNEFIHQFKKKKIEHFDIVATSAFRDTKNSEETRRLVENEIEHPIRIISGLEEAKLIQLHPDFGNNDDGMYVDVGGGSTEFLLFKNNRLVIKSFQLGAVRNMLRKDKANEWNKLEQWLLTTPKKKNLVGIGGNIRSFLSSINAKTTVKNEFISAKDKLNKLTYEEKINTYGFSKDRADVIDYALSIYEFILNRTDIKKIKATKWGVSDSAAVNLYQQIYSQNIKIKNN